MSRIVREKQNQDAVVNEKPARELAVAFFRRTTATQSNPITLTWPGTGPAALTEPARTTEDREAVPLIMAGTNDGQRGDAHVLSRSMMCMDIDCKRKVAEGESDAAWNSRSGKVRASFERALEQLSGSEGYDHAWHTTHSHNDGDRLCWRVWIPLAEDVSAPQLARWRDGMYAMNQRVFQLICDPTTYNPERLMRLPALHPANPDVFKNGFRADGNLLTFGEVLNWYDTLPPELRNRQRGQRGTKTYLKAEGSFPLPAEVVSALRRRCGEWATKESSVHKNETREALLSLARCEALKPGQRDNGLIGLVGIFSKRLLDYEVRPLLESLLLPVLEKTHEANPDDPIKPHIADPKDLFDDTVGKVERHREANAAETGHVWCSDEAADLIAHWTKGARRQGMTNDELGVMLQGIGAELEPFKHQIFVMYEDHYFVWLYDGYSGRRWTSKELTIGRARAALAALGFSQKRFDREKGELVSMSLAEMLERHGTIAETVRATYLEPRHRFEPNTKTFIEAMGPKRKLDAVQDAGIHEWLLLLGGEKLVDWLSVFPDVRRALSILFLIMPRNSGKTLLANGLARLWERGTPAEAANVFANFNGDLAESPFIFADEELPKLWGKSLGAELRRLVSTPDVTVQRKFQPNVKCSGYVRMLVAANSHNPLKGFAAGGQPTDQDLAAIAERLLTIECDERAARYLEKFEREELDSWRVNDTIAKHVLWLSQNWAVKDQGRRFAVEGNSEKALYRLIVGDELTSQVLDWFVTYALHATKKNTSSVKMGFFSHNGELYVSLATIIASWHDFRSGYRMGSTEPFIAALESVCHPGRCAVRRGGEEKEYWRVKFDYLEFYARRLGLGSNHLRSAIFEREDLTAEFLPDAVGDGNTESREVRDTAASAGSQEI